MWTHKKYKTAFKGTYQRTKSDRVFQLISEKKTISFESYQAAKKDGWVKVK